jgi:hypothetical protein
MFLSILLPLSRNLTPSLSYQIVRKRIAKVTDFLSFCPFGISIFPFCTFGISMYQKRILPFIIIPYFLTPSFFPFGAFRTDRRTEKFLHPPLPKFFFFSTERAGPYPQAQLYWAGRTMGWMADCTRMFSGGRHTEITKKPKTALSNIIKVILTITAIL